MLKAVPDNVLSKVSGAHTQVRPLHPGKRGKGEKRGRKRKEERGKKKKREKKREKEKKE